MKTSLKRLEVVTSLVPTMLAACLFQGCLRNGSVGSTSSTKQDVAASGSAESPCSQDQGQSPYVVSDELNYNEAPFGWQAGDSDPEYLEDESSSTVNSGGTDEATYQNQEAVDDAQYGLAGGAPCGIAVAETPAAPDWYASDRFLVQQIVPYYDGDEETGFTEVVPGHFSEMGKSVEGSFEKYVTVGTRLNPSIPNAKESNLEVSSLADLASAAWSANDKELIANVQTAADKDATKLFAQILEGTNGDVNQYLSRLKDARSLVAEQLKKDNPWRYSDGAASKVIDDSTMKNLFYMFQLRDRLDSRMGVVERSILTGGK